jgi:antitoxin component of MazEF toxin-antitoxin module
MKKEIDGKVFYENTRGMLIPEQMVKQYDLVKDQTVTHCFDRLMALRTEMQEAKAEVMQSIAELQEILAQQYKVQLGGEKENVRVTSFDGSVRIEVAVNEYQNFDEKIHLAKRVIDGCIEKWTNGANANLKVIIDQAFRLNQSGRMDIRSILNLRKLQIQDEDWKKAMDIIADSLQMVTTKKYLRVYMRAAAGKYQMVDFDLASI